VKVALSAGGQNQKLESVMSKPLKDQAFATPDKVAELVQKVCHYSLKICIHSCFGPYAKLSSKRVGENTTNERSCVHLWEYLSIMKAS
jgi:hypothetical protein